MIKTRIKKMGLTQKEFARLLSLSPEVVSQKIHNKKNVSLVQAKKMAEILEIKPEEFDTYFFNN